MKPKLSICIPTYNRAKFLKECLDSVLPQVKSKDEVEVIVIDNASSDDTQAIVEGYIAYYDCLKYYRNEKNLGYAGNQVKCIEYASGEYMSLLSDDDIYTDGQVERILKVLSTREYAFVALNYYGFLENVDKPYKSNFAPEKDVIFERAYDILNYPSVGHFSGLIFNAKLAKDTLQRILAKKSYRVSENGRGFIGDVAVRSTLASDLPAYFIGKRGLANRMPKNVGYNTLYHLCLDDFEYYYGLYKEGLINKNDFDFRRRAVIDRLPRSIISNGSALNDDEINRITDQLCKWLKGDKKFDKICLPLLYTLKYKAIRKIYQIAVNNYRRAKPRWYRLKS